MPKPQTFTARLEDKVIFNDKYVHYFFELEEPNRMEFKGGQFVSIQVDEKGTRRAYSIASSPAVGHGFELLVNNEPNGLGVNYLRNLQFGDKISCMAPLGVFTIAEESDEKALTFIGTGCGVSALRSMILEQLQKKQDKRKMVLYWGLRYVEDLFWANEFQNLATSFPHFHFHPTISRPSEGWTLCKGRVTDCLAIHDLLEDSGYYLCGMQVMIDDVVKLLKEKGVPEHRIHHEKFN